jgi:hypothetical protein
MGRDAIALFARVRVDLLVLPLESIKFLLEGSSLGSKPFDRFLVDSVTTVILLGDTPRVGVIPNILVGTGEFAVPTLWWYWLLPGCLLRIFCQFL